MKALSISLSALILLAACSSQKRATLSSAENLAGFAARPDFCASLSEPEQRQIKEGAQALVGKSPVYVRYRDRLVRETCLLLSLKYEAQPQSAICRELGADHASACYGRAVEALRRNEAFSYSGATLFLATHTQLVMNERGADKEGDAREQSLRSSFKLLDGIKLAQELVQNRARPRDWIGVRVPEIERQDLNMSLDFCRRVQDLGLRTVGDLRGLVEKDSSDDQRLNEQRDAIARLGSCNLR